MSIFTKDAAEQIRKAKYRVKNAQGQYEVVYLETSADQVEQTADRVFVTPAEKSQITANQQAISTEVAERKAADQALAGRLNVIEGEAEGSIKKALQDAKAHTNAEVVKLQNADTALENRIEANEAALGLVEGKITTAANNALADAKKDAQEKIAAVDAAFKAADMAINTRLQSLESNTADLTEIRNDITANTSAITKEVADRTEAVKNVNDALTAEIARATGVEDNLEGRINSLSSEVTRVAESVETEAANTLKSAKEYTDGKVSEINTNHNKLAERVTTNEAALGTVDSRISDAKSGAETTAKNYTDAEIVKLDAAYKAADAKVLSDAKADAKSKVDTLNTTLTQSINAVDAKVDGVDGKVTTLAGRVSVNEADITNLKQTVNNKNNNTVVVNAFGEIATANTNPKSGDLAFVVSEKKSYIHNGTDWVVFDEISSKLDLVDYMKTADANATFRKLSEKIAEGDLESTLATKINNKADKSYVDGELAKKTNEAYVNSKVEDVVSPVRTMANDNKVAIANEKTARESAISELQTSMNSKVETVKEDLNGLSTSLTEKETSLKAEDARLENRINKFVPVVSDVQPIGTETGHVWLQLV